MDASETYRSLAPTTFSDIEDVLLLTQFVRSQGHLAQALAYPGSPSTPSYSHHQDRARAERLLDYIAEHEPLADFSRFLEFRAAPALEQVRALVHLLAEPSQPESALPF